MPLLHLAHVALEFGHPCSPSRLAPAAFGGGSSRMLRRVALSGRLVSDPVPGRLNEILRKGHAVYLLALSKAVAQIQVLLAGAEPRQFAARPPKHDK